MKADKTLIRTKNLKKYYTTSDGLLDRLLGNEKLIKAVNGVDLEIREGETLGIVGESGCGKSSLGRTLLRLEEPTEGTIEYDGVDLTTLSTSELREYRKQLQFVFQNPQGSLNPRLTIGDIIGEPLDIHDFASGEEREERIRLLLQLVGLSPNQINRYPHEFSGGQIQRVSIARALAVDPQFIVYDEPVSALDVSVQAQILNLLERLQSELGLTYLVISHNLSVINHIADRVAVMYLGEIVEQGTVEDVFSEPLHPYTASLFSSIPEPDPLWERERVPLRGTVPSPENPPDGCSFHTRCPQIIAPERYDVEQSNWRSIMNLAGELRKDDTTIETLLPTMAVKEDRTEIDDMDGRIREAFSIDPSVADPRLSDTLNRIMAHLESGDIEAAREIAVSDLDTPCDSEEPELRSIERDHRVSCHLYSETHPGQPLSEG